MKNTIRVNGFDEAMHVRLVYRGTDHRRIFAEPIDDEEFGTVWNVSDSHGGHRDDYFTRDGLDALKLIRFLLEQE